MPAAPPAVTPLHGGAMGPGGRLDGTVFALANGLWFWSAVIAAAAGTLVQKHGEPQRV